MGFLLCGWVAAALWFWCCPGWDGACGIGWWLPVSVVGIPLHYLAPVRFQIFNVLLLDIRCETDIKFFFVVVFPSEL